jgi:hypothetical protein
LRITSNTANMAEGLRKYSTPRISNRTTSGALELQQ